MRGKSGTGPAFAVANCRNSEPRWTMTRLNLFRTLPVRLALSCAGLAFAAALPSAAQDDFFDNPAARERVASLSGKWRFSVGDDPAWAQPDFDDSAWTKIDAPDEWEDEGYRGYNGHAWYRKTFDLEEGDAAGRKLFVSLGQIDDVDQVFVNGRLIGASGQFPPHYVSAHNANRVYPIPSDCLRPGEKNLIAVRVYDGGGPGGMFDGTLAVLSTVYPKLALELPTTWKIQRGDNPAWAQPACDEAGFSAITVPGFWENAGLRDYDGFAWYRVSFNVVEGLDASTLVLLLGRIDDLDEVYLNGTRIGGTGNLDDPANNRGVEFHRQNRGYIFPASLLRAENVLAVRVYDGQGVGGIYTGPLGIMTQADYIAFWEERRRDDSSLWNWIRSLD
jgi:sialate O-acetylesterase